MSSNHNKRTSHASKKANSITPQYVLTYILGAIVVLLGIKKIKDGIKFIYRNTVGKIVTAVKDIFDDNGKVTKITDDAIMDNIVERTSDESTALVVAFQKTKRGPFRAVFNYALPLIALVLVVRVVVDYKDTRYALAVSSEAGVLGYVADEETYARARTIVQNRCVVVGDEQISIPKPSFDLQVVKEGEISNQYQLADLIIDSSEEQIKPAEGLFVEDVFLGAVEELGTVKEALDTIIDEYKNQEDVKDVNFVKNIKVKTGLYSAENIIPADQMKSFIVQDKGTTQEDEIEQDIPVSKARTVSIETDGEDVKEITTKKMLLSVSQTTSKDDTKVVEELVENTPKTFAVEYKLLKKTTEPIEYKTEKTKDNKMTKGKEKVLESGKKGVKEIVCEVTMVDGEEVNSVVVDTVISKEPVNERVAIGTAQEKYIWPLAGGYVSSGFGYRWGSVHPALDIAMRGNGGASGKPIVASKSGTVTFSGYEGSYGNLVRISHGNGMETWYAHNSNNLVSVGDEVDQGEVIAKVGATGTATGPHVHFEVRKDGTAQNPLGYINKQ